MRLLLCLAQRAGEVVSIDDLLREAWSGVIVTPDSVYQAVTSLRRVLGDDPKRPTYIATVPRLGYRMIANVSLWVDEPAVPTVLTAPTAPTVPTAPTAPTVPTAAAPSPPPAVASASPRAARFGFLAVVGAVCLALALALAFALRGKPINTSATAANAPPKSVAVLPFLDLTTQQMNEEYFADGMTEELIDKLSQIPGLRVPGPTSSFYFKGKKIKVADIAKSLGVMYVLDGSIRKSGDMLRVAARLIRADDGYVIWTDTYDRPMDNKLKVQDEIAGEVAKALMASIR